MYTRTGKAVFIVALLGFINADALAFLAMCDATPPPRYGWMFVAVLFQLCAVGAVGFCMQYFGLTYQPPRRPDADGRGNSVAMAVVFCLLSLALFRDALLFSDTLFTRGAVSAGASCKWEDHVGT